MNTENVLDSECTLHVSALLNVSLNSSEFRVWEILEGRCLVGESAFNSFFFWGIS